MITRATTETTLLRDITTAIEPNGRTTRFTACRRSNDGRWSTLLSSTDGAGTLHTTSRRKV